MQKVYKLIISYNILGLFQDLYNLNKLCIICALIRIRSFLHESV